MSSTANDTDVDTPIINPTAAAVIQFPPRFQVNPMSKAIPSVQKYMTTSPHTIGDDQPMSLAHRMMREHKIRHLPVLRGAKIVGWSRIAI